MLRELLSILRSDDPLGAMGEEFRRMLNLTYDMTMLAGEIYFGKKPSPEERSHIYQEDRQVNILERKIRKLVVAHLSIPSNRASVPYCLILMSLVKDVERLGDYAKNLSEVVEIHPDPLPDDDNVRELQEIRVGVERSFQSAYEVFATSDREKALELILAGRELAHRTDALLTKVAQGPYDAGTATALVLGARYYKRIGGHVLNVLSSVVMPVHKVDYYDEKEVVAPEPSEGSS
jgi:phosphate uptake regulator